MNWFILFARGETKKKYHNNGYYFGVEAKNGRMAIRTPDFSHAKRTLYQLSYTPRDTEFGTLNEHITTFAEDHTWSTWILYLHLRSCCAHSTNS